VLLVDQHYVEHAHRDSVGGTAVIGDLRWTGSYGINADLIAKTHCSVEYIKTKDIEVFGRSFALISIRCHAVEARPARGRNL
jgi:hypothetical protein